MSQLECPTYLIPYSWLLMGLRAVKSSYSKGPIPAHGTPDMPAWGDVFYNLKSDTKLIEARERNLTAYIESLRAAAE
jgi:hypothetical protein